MKRTVRDYALILLKGMGMGAADVVPGVSGGTIAFIVGIYEELINTIKSVNRQSVRLFFKGKWRELWHQVNGAFLFSLLAGIGISIFSLAKLITWLLHDYPVLVWSFFFGLVLASTWFVGKEIRRWNWKTVIAFVLGGVIAYGITVATPAETPTHPLFIALCGAVAICAMILPGISGSFILVLLGKYFYVLEAVKELRLVVLGSFAIGACIGITTFSRLLSYALRKVRYLTLALLSGFMIGSLNKVWPWKETMESYTDAHGNVRPLIEVNAAPNSYIVPAILLMLTGLFLVCFIEWLSTRTPAKKD